MTDVAQHTPPPRATSSSSPGRDAYSPSSVMHTPECAVRSLDIGGDAASAEALADAIRDAMYLTPRRTPNGGGAVSGGRAYSMASSSSSAASASSCSASSLRYSTPIMDSKSSSSSYAYGERDCAVCHSPLDRTRPEASDDPEKHDLVTGLTCRHVFHKCCLVQCRAHDIQKCPTCQQPLPRGFTPEAVREERNRNRMRDRIIARSRRATDAIRLARARAIVNGSGGHGGSPGMSSPGTPVGFGISLSQDAGAAAYAGIGLPPLAPRTCERGSGERSAGGRHHPYSPVSRSPSSGSEEDEFFVSLTQ